jgi:hypothetical protein
VAIGILCNRFLGIHSPRFGNLGHGIFLGRFRSDTSPSQCLSLKNKKKEKEKTESRKKRKKTKKNKETDPKRQKEKAIPKSCARGKK